MKEYLVIEVLYRDAVFRMLGLIFFIVVKTLCCDLFPFSTQLSLCDKWI